MRVKRPRAPIHYIDIPIFADDALILLIAVAGNHRILLSDELTKVKHWLVGGNTGIARIADIEDDFCCLNQVFRGQTAAVDAGTTERSCLGHDGPLAQLCGSERRSKGR